MAIAYVAGTIATPGANGGTTSSIDTTGANLLIVCVSAYATTPASISDSKGNTYTALTSRSNINSNVRLFYAENATVGSGHTFTYSATGSYPVISVQAFSGAKASGAYDQESGASASSPGSITPSEDNCMLSCGFCSGGYGGTHSIDSGFTISNSQGFNSGVNMGGGVAYQIQTTATAKNPTWSDVGSGVASAMASFKQASGGGATTSRARFLPTNWAA